MSRARLKELLDEGPQVSPFLVLGDPTPELSLALLKTAVDAGAQMIEIGFPYGDPVADGPSIQKADLRALGSGTSTSGAMRLLARFHEERPRAALNLLVYANLVHARGPDRFAAEAAEAGASSLLVPDVPLEESVPLRKVCRRARIAHVQLLGPLTSPSRLERIDRFADGFLYLVAHQSTTGVRKGDFAEVERLVSRTAAIARKPICLGFGLSSGEQIARAFAAGARIAVVGSHLADVIERAWVGNDERSLLESFTAALRPLMEGKEKTRAGDHATGRDTR